MLIEPLESRRLFSVTVTESYPGYFEIQGDDNANDISAAVSMSEESLAIDGQTYYGVSYVYINGGAGDDLISLVTIDGAGGIGGGIVAGEGNDNVTLNFDGGVWAGAGDDTIYLTDSFRGQAYGETGNDTMYIMGACIDPEILGGDGNDLIDCSQNEYGVVVRGGTGNDTVYGSEYADVIYGEQGTDFLSGNGGNDNFYAGPGPDDAIDGGDGYDTVHLASGSDFIAVRVEYVA